MRYCPTYPEIKVTVQTVLDGLKQNNLTVSKDKCVFGAKSVKFLGYIVSANSVLPDPGGVALSYRDTTVLFYFSEEQSCTFKWQNMITML